MEIFSEKIEEVNAISAVPNKKAPSEKLDFGIELLLLIDLLFLSEDFGRHYLH